MSPTFGKLFEYSILGKLNLQQFGFTSGLSPVMAGLLVSEAKAEAIQNGTVSGSGTGPLRVRYRT